MVAQQVLEKVRGQTQVLLASALCAYSFPLESGSIRAWQCLLITQTVRDEGLGLAWAV